MKSPMASNTCTPPPSSTHKLHKISSSTLACLSHVGGFDLCLGAAFTNKCLNHCKWKERCSISAVTRDTALADTASLFRQGYSAATSPGIQCCHVTRPISSMLAPGCTRWHQPHIVAPSPASPHAIHDRAETAVTEP